MVEPSKSVVGPEAVAAFAEVIGPDLGVGRIGGLQRLVELAPAALAAAGAFFVEYTRGGSRVIAASGVLDHFRGRLLQPDDLPMMTSPDAPWLREIGLAELGVVVRRQIAALGLARGIQATILVSGQPAGCFVFWYHSGVETRTSDRKPTICLVAACASGLYSFGMRPGVLAQRTLGECAARPATPTVDEDQNLFIAVTSHELRTPVTVIRGYADTLIERWEMLDEHSRRSAVGVICQRARELGRLLDRLLSAAGDGLRPAEEAASLPFDLVEAIRNAVFELPRDLSGSLRVGLPETMPKALGDRNAVSTVITELVTNASKCSPEISAIELTAGADRSQVWLRVADRGIGIRPEHTERAFERFWQSAEGMSRKRGGVGLGLYLVRRIVERHGGWVSLRPRDGGGAVAEVRLPRADITPEEVSKDVDHDR